MIYILSLINNSGKSKTSLFMTGILLLVLFASYSTDTTEEASTQTTNDVSNGQQDINDNQIDNNNISDTATENEDGEILEQQSRNRHTRTKRSNAARTT